MVRSCKWCDATMQISERARHKRKAKMENARADVYFLSFLYNWFFPSSSCTSPCWRCSSVFTQPPDHAHNVLHSRQPALPCVVSKYGAGGRNANSENQPLRPPT